MPGTKRCSRCTRDLPVDAFGMSSAAKDGRQAWCRFCHREYAAERRPRKLAAAPPVPAGRKWCRSCEQIKELDAFPLHNKMPDGRQTYCRECFARRYRAKREAQGLLTRPLEVPDGHKFCRSCRTTKPLTEFGLRRSPNGDGRMSACKECRKVQSRAGYVKRQYGFTEESVTGLLRQQGGLCAICRSAAAVHVDHDHGTGRVRGMLCFSCNAALGHFRDDPVVLRRAARYLEGALPPRRGRAHQAGLTYELLFPPDVRTPQPGDGVFERELRRLLADLRQ